MGSPGLGVYLTLYDDSRPSDQDSALGPFDELTVHSARVVAERGQLGRIVAAHGSNGGWLGVDSEAQRSFASGAAPLERSHIRVRAAEADVLLRLYDDAPERSAAVLELGPFGIVVIGTNDIRADGRTVAVRVSPTASWLLTDLAGTQLQGTAKTVLTLRAARSATGPDLSPPLSPDQPSPSVWVDRVRTPSQIYVSRPSPNKS